LSFKGTKFGLPCCACAEISNMCSHDSGVINLTLLSTVTFNDSINLHFLLVFVAFNLFSNVKWKQVYKFDNNI
jgi:hypothetical protein